MNNKSIAIDKKTIFDTIILWKFRYDVSAPPFGGCGPLAWNHTPKGVQSRIYHIATSSYQFSFSCWGRRYVGLFPCLNYPELMLKCKK